MKVSLLNGRAASEAEVQLAELELGTTFPAEFRAFLRSHNGARPSTNIFEFDRGRNDSAVLEFIPLEQMSYVASHIENLDPATIPIALAEGGNYVLLDSQLGRIVFWDHEVPDEKHLLATSFTQFLNEVLQPFDQRSVVFDPRDAKVSSVPGFLETLKKKH